MLLEPNLSCQAVFAADRREDVTVTVNAPIAEALGPHHVRVEDYLRKAGAAAIADHPEASVEFMVSRRFVDGPSHQFSVGMGLAPTAEVALRQTAEAASNYLRDFDPDAYITVSITITPPVPRIRTGRERSRYRWWRADG